MWSWSRFFASARLESPKSNNGSTFLLPKRWLHIATFERTFNNTKLKLPFHYLINRGNAKKIYLPSLWQCEDLIKWKIISQYFSFSRGIFCFPDSVLVSDLRTLTKKNLPEKISMENKRFHENRDRISHYVEVLKTSGKVFTILDIN